MLSISYHILSNTTIAVNYLVEESFMSYLLDSVISCLKSIFLYVHCVFAVFEL